MRLRLRVTVDLKENSSISQVECLSYVLESLKIHLFLEITGVMVLGDLEQLAHLV